MIQLPASKGYAELICEPVTARKRTAAPTELVLYFLNSDMTTPLATLPTEVMLETFDPEARQTIPQKLTSSPKPGDPIGSARFASGPIDRDYSQFALTGTLKVNLAGPLEVPF